MKKEIIEVLKKEIGWCEKNPLVRVTKKNCEDMTVMLTDSFGKGFKDGLRQAIRIIRKIPKTNK